MRPALGSAACRDRSWIFTNPFPARHIHRVSSILSAQSCTRNLSDQDPLEAAVHAAEVTHLALSPDPPSYAAISPSPPVKATSNVADALHPRVAVLLGVSVRWHIPLLICRALSTAPAAWWGLRCALTFLGELLRSEALGTQGIIWSVEKRFRVTEVFLAILWVGFALQCDHLEDSLH